MSLEIVTVIGDQGKKFATEEILRETRGIDGCWLLRRRSIGFKTLTSFYHNSIGIVICIEIIHVLYTITELTSN